MSFIYTFVVVVKLLRQNVLPPVVAASVDTKMALPLFDVNVVFDILIVFAAASRTIAMPVPDDILELLILESLIARSHIPYPNPAVVAITFVNDILVLGPTYTRMALPVPDAEALTFLNVMPEHDR